jgi:dehydrogenase/reductase SDR family member 7B
MAWTDKKIWIVGASSGIGAALVKALAEKGARLIISARRENLLNELAESCASGSVQVLPLDLAEPGMADAAVGKAWEIYGGLDWVFLNSGIAMRDMAVNSDLEASKKVMDINFWGPVALTKALLPRLTTGPEGHLVVTSSLSGKFGVPQMSIYSASKHALHGYFESLRTETFRSGLKIHLVIPGFVRTDIALSGLKGDGTPYRKPQPSLAQGMAPDLCARQILRNLEKDREEFVVGGTEKYMVWFHRMFPGLAKSVMRSNPMRRMRELKGRFFKSGK